MRASPCVRVSCQAARQCSSACQLLADLVQKRMHVVCLCRRVNLRIRGDRKTYWRLGKINCDCVCVPVTARTHGLNDTQTSRPSVSSDVVFASADDRLE